LCSCCFHSSTRCSDSSGTLVELGDGLDEADDDADDDPMVSAASLEMLGVLSEDVGELCSLAAGVTEAAPSAAKEEEPRWSLHSLYRLNFCLRKQEGLKPVGSV
jgi:hypothetical protein